MENKLSHFDTQGNAIMVDVSDKAETTRTAVASGIIKVNDAVMEAVVNKTVGSFSGIRLALRIIA